MARPAAGTLTLAEALDALAELATAAGADGEAARAEGLALAAAVAESAPGAARDWARGRRRRQHPGLLRRGEPRPPLAGRADGDAQLAGRAGLARTPRPTPRPSPRSPRRPAASASRRCGSSATPRSPPPRSSPRSRRRPAPTPPAGGAGRRLAPAEPERRPPRPDRPQPRQAARRGARPRSARRAAGRARRADRAGAGQARDPPAGRAAAGREAARRRRPEEPDDHPAPGLHRQPGHRQDDRRAARRRHLPRPRAALAGPPRRGRPLRARRGLPRPDRDQDGRGRRLGRGRRAVHRRGLQPDRAGPQGDQYGQEAVDTLVKEMEDRRDDLVVIVAGYPAPMAAFIAANPGLASRFRTTIDFEDYTDDELVAILDPLAAGADYELVPEAVERFREMLGRTPRGDGFGNGRFARNALEAAIGHHAWRLREIEAPDRRPAAPAGGPGLRRGPLDEGRRRRVRRGRRPRTRSRGPRRLRRHAVTTRQHAPVPPAAAPAPAAAAGAGATPDQAPTRPPRSGLRWPPVAAGRPRCAPAWRARPGRLPGSRSLSGGRRLAVRARGGVLVPVRGRRPGPGRRPTPTSWSGSRRSRPTLVQADADATNAFLVGGLEPAEQRDDYNDGGRLGVAS